MKRKNFWRAVLGGALLLSPVAALAGIDSTHHDMPYLSVSQEKCSYCHSKVIGAAVLARADVNLKKVGQFCVLVCHLNGTGVTGRSEVVPTSPGTYGAYTAGAILPDSGNAGYGKDGTLAMTATDNTNTVLLLTQGHGMNKAKPFLPADEVAAITATNWPHTSTDDLQCTSCHAVHDGENPPFLNAQLNTFCQSCHANASRTAGLGDNSGNHPVDIKWEPAIALSSRNRDIGALTTMPANINVVVPGVGNTAAKTAVAGTGVSWAMGGHLISDTTGLPVTAAYATNKFTCVSCHQVHDATSGATGENGDTLTVGNELETVCYGCHTIEPGATGMGHPIGEEVTTSSLRGWQADLESKLSVGYNGPAHDGAAGVAAGVNGPNATTSSPTCTTCHDVHGGATGRLAIRVIGGKATYATADSVCDTCHVGSFSNPDNGADKHHPGVVYASPSTVYTSKNYPSSTSWATKDGNGDLTDGLSCQDCHVGNGAPTTQNSTAHNW